MRKSRKEKERERVCEKRSRVHGRGVCLCAPELGATPDGTAPHWALGLPMPGTPLSRQIFSGLHCISRHIRPPSNRANHELQRARRGAAGACMGGLSRVREGPQRDWDCRELEQNGHGIVGTWARDWRELLRNCRWDDEVLWLLLRDPEGLLEFRRRRRPSVRLGKRRRLRIGWDVFKQQRFKPIITANAIQYCAMIVKCHIYSSRSYAWWQV